MDSFNRLSPSESQTVAFTDLLPECVFGNEFFDRVATITLDESGAVRTIHVATARGRVGSPSR